MHRAAVARPAGPVDNFPIADSLGEDPQELESSAMHRRTSAVLVLCLLAGCTSRQAEIDSLVEEVWIDINQDRRIDAVEYLTQGGKHTEPWKAAGPDDLDRTVVLPLMKRFKEEFRAEPWAHLQEPDDFAWTFCVRLPASGGARSGMARAIREAESRFEGTIETTWGNRWLVIDFIDGPLEEDE
jgi:hypothetical protein